MARKKTAKRSGVDTTSKVLLTLVELIGLGLSVFLLLISMKIIYKDNIPCPRGSLFACSHILQGKYAHLGPVPIALLGALYFVWQLLLTWATKRTGWARNIKLLSVLGGLAFVAGLRVFEIVWLKKICPWCYGVALVTIIEAILFYPIAAPPLPRLGPVVRSAVVFVIFLLMIAVGVAAGMLIKEPTKMMRADDATEKPVKTPKPATPPKRTPEATKKSTPKETPKSTPKADAAVQGGLTKRGSKSGAKKTPAPEEADLVSDTEETRLLRSAGWKLVASEQQIMTIAKEQAPILLFVYDPECGECQAYSHGELSSQEMAAFEITKVAIDESRLEAAISDQVENVPTLMVLDQQGNVRWKQEGRISLQDIILNVQAVMF